MRRSLLVALAAFAVLVLPRFASAQVDHPQDSPKTTLQVPATMVVGTAVLKAGEYKVQCRHIDGKEYLVIWSAESGKEITRVPCQPESLAEKVTRSSYITIVGPDGTRTLKAVRIKGETVAHTIVE